LVTPESRPTYLFGDLLALARQSWVRAMAGRLEQRGHGDYRRSDAAALRLLRRRPLSIGELGEVVGVTRQAARKMAAGLQQRGYARLERDPRDSRRLNVVLTDAGEEYARDVSDVIEVLNRELRDRVDPAQLVAADTVLRAAIGDARERARAGLLVAPPVTADSHDSGSSG
jgi:DNA-binding MarR family transcriptional regulator